MLGFSRLDLRILSEHGTAEEKNNSTKILRIGKRGIVLLPVHSFIWLLYILGNFLLLTILLANGMSTPFPASIDRFPIFFPLNIVSVFTDAGVAVLLSSAFNPVIGFFLTAAMIFIEEVISRAVCAHNALAVGGALWWVGVLLMYLLGIITYPTGKLLDLILGRDMHLVYNRAQLKKLIKLQIAKDRSSLEDENLIDESDFVLIENTFDFSTKTAQQVMTPIEDVYMINVCILFSFNLIPSLIP